MPENYEGEMIFARVRNSYPIGKDSFIVQVEWNDSRNGNKRIERLDLVTSQDYSDSVDQVVAFRVRSWVDKNTHLLRRAVVD